MTNPKAENLIIIGAGPAGLTAALYAGRAGLSPLVLAGSPSQSQILLTSEIENFPALEAESGFHLIEKLKKQAKSFGARIEEKNVTRVNFKKKPFEIYAEKSYLAKSVIIATGAKAIWLGLESEARLRGKGVSVCATCDGFFFRGQNVAVVGGGNAALQEALFLTKFVSRVYLIHRRDSFRATKILQERVFKNQKIEVVWNSTVTEVIGKDKVERIRLKPDKTLKVSGLFVAIGHKPSTDLFLGQIKMDKRGHILTSADLALAKMKIEVNAANQGATETERETIKEINYLLKEFDFNYRFMTSVRGVFAAGDCVDHDYRQASTASGAGAAAALEVEKWLEGSNG